jgi:hypothetical protein
MMVVEDDRISSEYDRQDYIYIWNTYLLEWLYLLHLFLSYS